MSYNVGDRIVYPMYGAGIIGEIMDREVFGEVRKYYKLQLSYGNVTLSVPVDNAVELGIRDVIDVADIEKVIIRLIQPCVESKVNWNKRHRENVEKMRSGNIYDVADVFKFLYIREKTRLLSTGEKKMLLNAKQILISELILSSDKDVEDVEKMVTDACDCEVEDIV